MEGLSPSPPRGLNTTMPASTTPSATPPAAHSSQLTSQQQNSSGNAISLTMNNNNIHNTGGSETANNNSAIHNSPKIVMRGGPVSATNSGSVNVSQSPAMILPMQSSTSGIASTNTTNNGNNGHNSSSSAGTAGLTSISLQQTNQAHVSSSVGVGSNTPNNNNSNKNSSMGVSKQGSVIHQQRSKTRGGDSGGGGGESGGGSSDGSIERHSSGGVGDASHAMPSIASSVAVINGATYNMSTDTSKLQQQNFALDELQHLQQQQQPQQQPQQQQQQFDIALANNNSSFFASSSGSPSPHMVVHPSTTSGLATSNQQAQTKATGADRTAIDNSDSQQQQPLHHTYSTIPNNSIFTATTSGPAGGGLLSNASVFVSPAAGGGNNSNNSTPAMLPTSSFFASMSHLPAFLQQQQQQQLYQTQQPVSVSNFNSNAIDPAQLTLSLSQQQQHLLGNGHNSNSDNNTLRFSCAVYENERYSYGHIYVERTQLFFASNLKRDKVVMPYHAVKTIEKKLVVVRGSHEAVIVVTLTHKQGSIALHKLRDLEGVYEEIVTRIEGVQGSVRSTSGRHSSPSRGNVVRFPGKAQPGGLTVKAQPAPTQQQNNRANNTTVNAIATTSAQLNRTAASAASGSLNTNGDSSIVKAVSGTTSSAMQHQLAVSQGATAGQQPGTVHVLNGTGSALLGTYSAIVASSGLAVPGLQSLNAASFPLNGNPGRGMYFQGIQAGSGAPGPVEQVGAGSGGNDPNSSSNINNRTHLGGSFVPPINSSHHRGDVSSDADGGDSGFLASMLERFIDVALNPNAAAMLRSWISWKLLVVFLVALPLLIHIHVAFPANPGPPMIADDELMTMIAVPVINSNNEKDGTTGGGVSESKKNALTRSRLYHLNDPYASSPFGDGVSVLCAHRNKANGVTTRFDESSLHTINFRSQLNHLLSHGADLLTFGDALFRYHRAVGAQVLQQDLSAKMFEVAKGSNVDATSKSNEGPSVRGKSEGALRAATQMSAELFAPWGPFPFAGGHRGLFELATAKSLTPIITTVNSSIVCPLLPQADPKYAHVSPPNPPGAGTLRIVSSPSLLLRLLSSPPAPLEVALSTVLSQQSNLFLWAWVILGVLIVAINIK